CAHDEEGGAPPEGRAHDAAERHPETEAHEEQALLDGEGRPPLGGRVVVAYEAGRRGLGDSLAGPEGRADGEESREVGRGSREAGDGRPPHDRVPDGAGAVPAVGEITG